MANEGKIIIQPHRFRFSDMAYEEIEGRFFEKFGRLPNAMEAMTFYAIETKQCPLCEQKFKSWDGSITKHMIQHYQPFMQETDGEQLWQSANTVKK